MCFVFTCLSGSKEKSFSLPSFLLILLSCSVSLAYCETGPQWNMLLNILPSSMRMLKHKYWTSLKMCECWVTIPTTTMQFCFYYASAQWGWKHDKRKYPKKMLDFSELTGKTNLNFKCVWRFQVRDNQGNQYWIQAHCFGASRIDTVEDFFTDFLVYFNLCCPSAKNPLQWSISLITVYTNRLFSASLFGS